ncbi:MAG: M56 family metallopeptidase [Cyanobacteria bacterium P01_D01_bin.105]
MMHLQMVGIALVCAIAIRVGVGYWTLKRASQPEAEWQSRWRRAMTTFVAPPLLLMATAVAIVAMEAATGYRSFESYLSYGLSILFIGAGIFAWGQLSWAALNARSKLCRVPYQSIEASDRTPLAAGRVIDTPTVFSAQVGLWSSELVVSQGLMDHLDDEHLAAVLAHESGHAHYRDTFWFFLLGCLRRLTVWLPYSEALWQELLLLREIRADRWAARSVDALVLAEALMSVITAPLMPLESICPGFSCAAPRSRLAQRIDALLESSPVTDRLHLNVWQWCVMSLAFSPLLTIPFHY